LNCHIFTGFFCEVVGQPTGVSLRLSIGRRSKVSAPLTSLFVGRSLHAKYGPRTRWSSSQDTTLDECR
jgi:hypothetical protein